MRAFLLPLGVAAALALMGCAAQRAYGDGKDLVEQGRLDEGLAKFQEALAKDPKDARYRSAFLQAREHALAGYAEQGDAAARTGATDAARALYRKALAIDPTYPRALDGLAALDARARQAVWLDDVTAALKKGDVATARAKIERVLAESPSNARALSLKRALDEKLAPASAESQLAQIYRRPVTIEFKDVSLKQVFEVIAHSAGINFLFDKDVKTDQRTSIFLKNSNVEAAVHDVLLTNQLEQQVVDGNTVLIYPNTAAKQKDYQQLDVRTFYLTNAEAKSVAATLKTIIKSRDIVVDEKLNLVIVRDTPDALRMAEKLVALQDVAEPEVMLEVEVLEVQRNRTMNLGIQWPASVGLTPLPLGTASGAGAGTNADGTPATTSGLSLHDLLHQNANSIGAVIGGATINANVVDSDAKLLTNPRIRVRNHEKAKILIGERVPNITSTATSTGFLSQSVNYIDVGLTLNVEPTVYLDDDVGIKVTLEVSSLLKTITTSSGTSAYEIGTRTATTALRLKNGETDVLAGLIDSQERTSGNKLPGVGELPIIGRLFGASTDDAANTEIVLAITPHLIRNVQRPDAADASFHSGTETSLHTAPDNLGAGSPSPIVVSTPAAAATATATAPAGTPAATPAPVPPAPNGDTSGGSGAGGASGAAAASAAGGTDGAADAAAPAGVAQLQWQGPAQVAVGGTLTLNVVAQSTAPVTGLPFTLGFNSGKLQLLGVTEGPFLKQAGATTSFSSRVSGDGQLAISDTVSSGTGGSASGIVATVSFKALGPVAASNVLLMRASPVGAANTALSAVLPAPFAVRIQ